MEAECEELSLAVLLGAEYGDGGGGGCGGRDRDGKGGRGLVSGECWVREVVGFGVGVVEETAGFVLESAGKSFSLQLGAYLAGKLVGYGDGRRLVERH